MDTKQGIEIIDLTKEYEQKFAEIMTHDEYHIETAKLEFADEIYDHMEAQGINQTQLADKLGSTKQYVSKLLSGYANPTIASLVKIARRLNCKFVFRLESKVESINKTDLKVRIHQNESLNRITNSNAEVNNRNDRVPFAA